LRWIPICPRPAATAAALGEMTPISWPHRPASMGKPAAPPLIEPNLILSKTDEGLGPGEDATNSSLLIGDLRSPRRNQRCGAENCGRVARRNVSRWDVLALAPYLFSFVTWDAAESAYVMPMRSRLLYTRTLSYEDGSATESSTKFNTMPLVPAEAWFYSPRERVEREREPEFRLSL
jgi:hypothetical protein